jgi:hypothetical protein
MILVHDRGIDVGEASEPFRVSSRIRMDEWCVSVSICIYAIEIGNLTENRIARNSGCELDG